MLFFLVTGSNRNPNPWNGYGWSSIPVLLYHNIILLQAFYTINLEGDFVYLQKDLLSGQFLHLSQKWLRTKRNGQNLQIQCNVNDHSTTFLNISKILKIHLCEFNVEIVKFQKLQENFQKIFRKYKMHKIQYD